MFLGVSAPNTSPSENQAVLIELPISQNWLADAVYWNDETGLLVDVNDAACEALGIPRSELLKMKVWEMDISFKEDTWNEAWKRALKARRMQIRTKHFNLSGDSYWVDMTIQACNVEGRTLICSIARNVEREAQLRKEIKSLEKRLRSA